MVLHEIPYDEPKRSTPPSAPGSDDAQQAIASRLASPTDRLAACVADFILFVPLMALAIAPFRRAGLEAQVLGQQSEYGSALAGAAAAAYFTLVAYQTLFVAWLGATPGKRILGLRIEPIWSGAGKPSPMAAFIRACVWGLEVAALGMPFLSVFGNERRRPFHDRAADTVVTVAKGQRRRPVGPPSLSELSMSAGFFSAIWVSVLLVVSFQIVHSMKKRSTGHSVAEMEASGDLCPVVTDAQRSWAGTGSTAASPTATNSMNASAGAQKISRLDTALALYAGEVIDEECLKAEVDQAFWREKDNDAAYLAKAFIEADNPGLYDSYLEKVCEIRPDGDPCRVVRLIHLPPLAAESEAEEKVLEVARENEIEGILADIQPTSAPYLRVWSVRHLMEVNRHSRALSLLDDAKMSEMLGPFFIRERAKALWHLERHTEARAIMRASVDIFNLDQRVDISRWFCTQETIEASCSNEVASESRASCDILASIVDQNEHVLADGETAIAYLRGESCADRLTTEKLTKIKDHIEDVEGKRYVAALLELESDRRQEGLDLLREIAASELKQGPFFIEANTRLADLASNVQELDAVKTVWLETDPLEEGWSPLGRRLMERFNSLGAWDRSVEVGLKMAQDGDVDSKSVRSMVVAAFRAGNVRMARGFLESLVRRGESFASSASASRGERSPASQDGFDEVVRELLGSSAIGNSAKGKGTL